MVQTSTVSSSSGGNITISGVRQQVKNT